MKRIFLLLLAFYAYPVAAELPPKIQADLYLVQADEKLKAEEYRESAEFMDKIVALSRQHPDEVKLPPEFYFRYAKVLGSAQRYEEATDAIHDYLEAHGQEGAHYREALTLLSQMEDAISQIKDSINEKDINGETPLHDAAFSGRYEIAKLLLEHGADVNAKDGSGETPLHDAAWGGHYETAKLLLEHGADVNEKNEYGSTPLHRVASYGRSGRVHSYETVKLLLEHGADVNAKNKGGNTPLKYALENDYHNTAELLRNKGGKE